MYLQQKIEQALWRIAKDIRSTKDAGQHAILLSKACKKFGVKVRVGKSTDAKWRIRGAFFPEDESIVLWIECSNTEKPHNLDSIGKLGRFLFDVSCTIQHELIHKYQWLCRDSDLHGPKIIRSKSNTDSSEYLSCMDEIDAQAHDLAMEIAYFYPKLAPELILRKYFETREVYLPTLNSYMKEFNSDTMHPVMRRLFHRLFLWLPKVEVRKPITYRGRKHA